MEKTITLKLDRIRSFLDMLKNKHISLTDMVVDGQPVLVQKYANGEEEYLTLVVNDQTGEHHFKRVPKAMLDIRAGSSEILSDISLVLDADLNYPTMLQKMAQFEGLYDEDEDFSEIDSETGEPISEYELRTQAVMQQLADHRAKQRSDDADKKSSVKADMHSEREEASVSAREEAV